MCKDDDITSADERCNIRQPFLGIRLDRLDRFVADTDMAPGMACECPAVCLDRIGYFFRLLALFIPVEIRVCIKPCYLIIRQIFSRLVITVGAVSEDSVSPGNPTIMSVLISISGISFFNFSTRDRYCSFVYRLFILLKISVLPD